MHLRGPGRAPVFTIRAKFLLGVLALTAMTGCVGICGIHGVAASGALLAHTFDGPLRTIAYTRKVQTDFAALRLAQVQEQAAMDLLQQRQAGLQLDALVQQTSDDIVAIQQHAHSAAAAAAAQSMAYDFGTWDLLRRQAEAGAMSPGFQGSLDRRAEALVGKLDALWRTAAADCVQDRAHTMVSIERFRWWSIVATFVALMIGTVVAFRLARDIVRPVAAASAAAGRIAAGELDVEIVPAGCGELVQLLQAMATMRDNIRMMMEGERAARRSAQGRLMNAIDGLAEGIALVGGDGRLSLTNARFDAFPLSAEAQAAGATLTPAAEAALATASGEMQIADGRWLRLSRSDRIDGGFVVIASDITPLKEREAALQAAKEQAEAANRAKTEFLTNMSHELRTPLTAIIGFSEIIVSESFGPLGQPKYREFADDILHSGRHLLEVINDMLDIAKLQSGMTELRLQPVRSRGIIDAAVRIVRKKAEQAGIALEVALPADMPLIHVDHLRMRQVLLNLLSNAIKFTPAGGTVSISAECREAGLALSVTDTGIGMAPEDIPRALQPFVQVDNSLARRHGGTGLGLPLSKLFVDLHGGQFMIDSVQGQGTAVTIVLPTVEQAVTQQVAA